MYVGGDIDSSITLSPRHFLTLNPDTGIPEVEASTNDLEYTPYESTAGRLLQLWKKGQRLLDMFWKIWRDEYLLSLRERTQSVLKSRRIESYYSPKVDDVVLIKDNVPRGCWKVGKVVSLVSSLDGCVRSAKVYLSSGRVIARPSNHFYPLEVCEGASDPTESNEKQPSVPSKEESTNRRKIRTAAKRAKEKIKQMLSE